MRLTSLSSAQLVQKSPVSSYSAGRKTEWKPSIHLWRIENTAILFFCASDSRSNVDPMPQTISVTPTRKLANLAPSSTIRPQRFNYALFFLASSDHQNSTQKCEFTISMNCQPLSIMAKDSIITNWLPLTTVANRYHLCTAFKFRWSLTDINQLSKSNCWCRFLLN